jgi:hypothetical protein
LTRWWWGVPAVCNFVVLDANIKCHDNLLSVEKKFKLGWLW